MNRLASLLLAAAAIVGGAALWLTMKLDAAQSVHPFSLPTLPASEKTTTPPAHQTIPPVRVRLSTHKPDRATIRIDGQYQITALGDWWVLAQGAKLEQVETCLGPRGIEIGGQQFSTERVHIEVRRSGTLWVDGRQYRGSLNLIGHVDGQLQVVNVVDLPSYLASVLPSEMPSSFPVEAQLAQTIAARTFALYKMKTYGVGNDFDVYDSARSQTYLGMQSTSKEGSLQAVETDQSRQIVERARGLVLGYRGKLFCTHYSAVCGGHTADGHSVFGAVSPPLVSVRCTGCTDGPNYRWQQSFPLSEIQALITQHLTPQGKRLGQLEKVVVRDPGQGFVPTVELTGKLATHTLSATQFRSYTLQGRLPSAWFSVKFVRSGDRSVDDQVVFSGRGWGHGVGLCQWGARGLAASGKTAAQILEHYYPTSELLRVE